MTFLDAALVPVKLGLKSFSPVIPAVSTTPPPLWREERSRPKLERHPHLLSPGRPSPRPCTFFSAQMTIQLSPCPFLRHFFFVEVYRADGFFGLPRSFFGRPFPPFGRSLSSTGPAKDHPPFHIEHSSPSAAGHGFYLSLAHTAASL